MKHRVLISIVLACSLSAGSHAQQSHIGIMAGPTASLMSGDYVTSSSGLELGWSFLATLDHEFNETWGLEVGAGWYQKGANRIELADTPGETWGYSTSYFLAPIQVRTKFRVAGGRLSLAPHTGVAVGIALGCKVKPGGQFEFDDKCEESSPGGTLEKLELSVPIGVAFSVEHPGGSRFTVIDLQYHLGLTNAFSAAKDAGMSAKNGMFVFQFGFAIPLN